MNNKKIYNHLAKVLIIARKKHTAEKAREILPLFANELKKFIEKTSKYSDLTYIALIDYDFLFKSIRNNLYKDCIETTITTNGLLSQVLQQAGIENYESVSDSIHNSFIDLINLFEEDNKEKIDKTKNNIYCILDEYLYDF